ncbi:MAG: aminotransferase class I/II-fold pyridoxal phosphate-dependent enzyme [Paenisporosarcina sp.]
MPNHGANPHQLYKSLGINPPERIIDFSENVNPFGPPDFIQTDWHKFQPFMMGYPDPLGEPFRTAVAKFHNISNDSIFVANGASEIFSLLAQKYRGKRAIIVHPTFSEYETTLKARDVEIVDLHMTDIVTGEYPIDEIKMHMHQADVLYLCTPNNPTGTLPKREVLVDLIEYSKKANCDIVLDEAFIDFISEQSSFISSMNYKNLIIVRSMTKMYAMPGLRLGYMAASTSVVKEIQQLAPHWNVNRLSAEIGSLVLKDEEYRQKTILHSQNMLLDMKAFLKSKGCEVTQSQANFLLFKLQQPDSEFFHYFLRKGLVLRHTENFQGLNGQWYRIGMKTAEDMEILKKELTVWFEAR